MPGCGALPAAYAPAETAISNTANVFLALKCIMGSLLMEAPQWGQLPSKWNDVLRYRAYHSGLRSRREDWSRAVLCARHLPHDRASKSHHKVWARPIVKHISFGAAIY